MMMIMPALHWQPSAMSLVLLSVLLKELPQTSFVCPLHECYNFIPSHEFECWLQHYNQPMLFSSQDCTKDRAQWCYSH